MNQICFFIFENAVTPLEPLRPIPVMWLEIYTEESQNPHVVSFAGPGVAGSLMSPAITLVGWLSPLIQKPAPVFHLCIMSLEGKASLSP